MSRKQAQRWANMMPSGRSGRPLMGVYDLMQDDIQSAFFTNPYGAQDYFVDLNVVADGDGKSWDTAVGTAAAAIVLSDASIGLTANRWWARRNRIFVCGDELHEDITALSEKTDIIGVGTDLSPYPRFMHSWAITTGVNGARFINVGFWNNAADVGMAIPINSHGNEFWNCHFDSNALGTHGLRITSSSKTKIMGCEFTNADGTKYTTAAVDLVGACHNLEINDCYIEGVIAIAKDATATSSGRIVNSTLVATNLIVDDDSSTLVVANCDLITAANSGNAFADTAMDMNLNLAVGNQLVSGDSNGPFPNIIVLA